MVKFREASPGAAYEIAVGVYDAEEASKAGLAVVETTAEGVPTAYGRYKDAPEGGPLGITVDMPGNTKVVAGGTAAPSAPSATTAGKGDILNVNDPFVHGGTGDDTIHADGSAPGKTSDDEDRTALIAAAEKSITDATKRGK